MTNGEKEKAIEYFKWWKSLNEHTQKAIPRDAIAYKAYQTEIGFYDMAIEALEQEPTTKNDLGVDAVSRKAVINQIFYSTDNNGDVVLGSALRERIARLPSVTPQEPRWIPVSERLPENKETVLVAFKHFVSGNTIGLGSVILLRDKPHWHVREQNLGTYDVLAWMPLPKPYEPQESEE